jgi:alpha-L-fucosidase
MQEQLRELLTNYGPVGIIWFDWGIMPEGKAFLKRAARIGAMIRKLQPACLVNNRFDGIKGDYGTPEQRIPGGAQKQAFETCMTLNNSWGYSRNDHNWKDAAAVVRNLVDIVQKGGNYLLNVGPTAAGVIPAQAAKVLKRVGRWLKVNGESVYGAGTSTLHTSWLEDIGAVTARPGRCYLHVFKWPADRKLFLYDFKNKRFRRAFLLADPRKTALKAEVHSRSLTLHLPATAPDTLDSVVAVDWKDDG